jgi:SWI/SNF-related matrix-associated actin-dependent regulator 1 of chromatin subfamily A
MGQPVAPIITADTKKVWINTGSSNEAELQDYLRSKFMIRRLRSEVLPQLPATQRQVVVLDVDGIANILKVERRTYAEFGDSIADLDIASPAFGEISKVRALLGVKKVPFIIDRVREALADTKKIVVFVHHHEVVDLLAAEFGQSCVVLDGRVDADDRQAIVGRFRDERNIEIMLATIDAAGVGFTLTAAWLVIFGELEWVPSKMRQAEDRLNRIGQKESVHAMYLVAAGTLDERQFQLLVEKQEIADAILD